MTKATSMAKTKTQGVIGHEGWGLHFPHGFRLFGSGVFLAMQDQAGPICQLQKPVSCASLVIGWVGRHTTKSVTFLKFHLATQPPMLPQEEVPTCQEVSWPPVCMVQTKTHSIEQLAIVSAQGHREHMRTMPTSLSSLMFGAGSQGLGKLVPLCFTLQEVCLLQSPRGEAAPIWQGAGHSEHEFVLPIFAQKRRPPSAQIDRVPYPPPVGTQGHPRVPKRPGKPTFSACFFFNGHTVATFTHPGGHSEAPPNAHPGWVPYPLILGTQTLAWGQEGCA